MNEIEQVCWELSQKGDRGWSSGVATERAARVWLGLRMCAMNYPPHLLLVASLAHDVEELERALMMNEHPALELAEPRQSPEQ